MKKIFENNLVIELIEYMKIYRTEFIGAFMLLQIGLLFIKGFVFLSALNFLIVLSLVLFLRSLGEKPLRVMLFIIPSFYFFILKIIFYFFSKLPQIEESGAVLFIVTLLVSAIYLIGLRGENMKNLSEKIKDIDLAVETGVLKNKRHEIINAADIILGYEIDTVNYKEAVRKAKVQGRTPELSELKYSKNLLGEKIPIIYKENDRYVHSITIGPTGCGKTSQIILPMINQDMNNRKCSITVLEPKGDLAEKVWAMAKMKGRNVLYFNPTYPDCPYFNPMAGEERTVMENIVTTFTMLAPTDNQFFKTQNEVALRNSIKVIKRLMGDEATLLDLLKILQNSQNKGKQMLQSFSQLPRYSEEISSENDDLYSWFMDTYYNPKSKVSEFVEGIKGELIKITSNEYLRRVLNPPKGMNQVDFVKHLDSYDVIAMSTAQGELGSLNMYLGYFLILQFQSAVFSRPGDEQTRIPDFLYIDEFQEFANDGFDKMLTQGRSYRVSSNLATQAIALIGKNSGNNADSFIKTVLTNARTQVVFPGSNNEDAKYFAERSGEKINYEVQVGVTSERFNPLKGINDLQYDKEQRRKTEILEDKFSISDIIYQPFEVVFVSLILENTPHEAKMARISWLEKEHAAAIDEMARKYREEQIAKRDQIQDDMNAIKEKHHPSLNGKSTSKDAIQMAKDMGEFSDKNPVTYEEINNQQSGIIDLRLDKVDDEF